MKKRLVLISLLVWFCSACSFHIHPASADKLNTEQGPKDWAVEESLQAAARHPTERD